MNKVGKEVFVQQIAATSIQLFQGKKEDPIWLYWNDYYTETDNNVICSSTNSNDQQDDDTIIKSKRHKIIHLWGMMIIYGKKIIIQEVH
jgi:hypothetical protein